VPTIGDLLADPHLGLRLLAAQGANHREIRWAHATELADPTEFIEGGELLLLTGVALPSDGAGQAAYVERVAAAGVAGLGFGVGLSHCSVPPALVEAADRRALPLLEVPRPTPFMAITRAVADALARRELLRNDPPARVDMLRSLTAWLAHHGQWEPAAAELGIGTPCGAGYSGPSPCSAADSTRPISVPSCGWRSGLRILRRGIPGCRTG
jgi:purine catabolism regulator